MRSAGTARPGRASWLLGACYVYVLAVALVRTVQELKDTATSSAQYHLAGEAVSGYYISYAHGFIRRGLPGAVLALFGTPSAHGAAILFWLLTALAYAAVAVTALLLVLVVRGRSRRLELTAIVLACPFALVAAGIYIGRYDAIALVLLVAIAWLGARGPDRLPTALAVGVLALAVVLSTLSEELVFPFFVPVVLVFAACTLAPATSSVRRRLTSPPVLACTALALVPGLVVAVASYSSRIPAGVIANAQRAAGEHLGAYDAATALGWSLGQEWDYIRPFGLENIVLGTAIWLVIFALTLLAIDAVIGPLGRAYWLSGAFCGLYACSLSAIGVDWRRWWLLAFTAQMATTVLLLSGRAAPARSAGALASPRALRRLFARDPRLAHAAVVLVLLVSVGTVEFHGIIPIHLLVTAVYWKSDLTYWIPGHHSLACGLGLSSSSC